MDYPRDLTGYAGKPPHPNWPGNARIAVQIVLNYEEGSESCILHGDAAAESYMSEFIGALPLPGVRNLNMESVYEYGSRAGFWRLMGVFAKREIPITIYGVGMALERNPAACAAIKEAGHEVASHGWRWIDYQYVGEAVEREHMKRSIEAIERAVGSRPLGWYCGRVSPNTRRLVVEEGGFLYDSDSYADDIPYWDTGHGRPHLVIPYSVDTNDMRFGMAQGFNCGDQFFSYLRDAFDVLYREGESAPKMMSVGLHCRLTGRPGRTAAFERFLDYVLAHERVWICRRVDIARHWRGAHPHPDFAEGTAR